MPSSSSCSSSSSCPQGKTITGTKTTSSDSSHCAGSNTNVAISDMSTVTRITKSAAQSGTESVAESKKQQQLFEKQLFVEIARRKENEKVLYTNLQAAKTIQKKMEEKLIQLRDLLKKANLKLEKYEKLFGPLTLDKDSDTVGLRNSSTNNNIILAKKVPNLDLDIQTTSQNSKFESVTVTTEKQITKTNLSEKSQCVIQGLCSKQPLVELASSPSPWISAKAQSKSSKDFSLHSTFDENQKSGNVSNQIQKQPHHHDNDDQKNQSNQNQQQDLKKVQENMWHRIQRDRERQEYRNHLNVPKRRKLEVAKAINAHNNALETNNIHNVSSDFKLTKSSSESSIQAPVFKGLDSVAAVTTTSNSNIKGSRDSESELFSSTTTVSIRPEILESDRESAIVDVCNANGNHLNGNAGKSASPQLIRTFTPDFFWDIDFVKTGIDPEKNL